MKSSGSADPATDAALVAFIAEKKAAMPGAFGRSEPGSARQTGGRTRVGALIHDEVWRMGAGANAAVMGWR